jgi:hypothetical protein
VAIVLALGFFAGACGGDRDGFGVHYSNDEGTPDSPAAADLVEAPLTPSPSVSGPGDLRLTGPEQEALTASADLAVGFVEALGANELERAAGLTDGPAGDFVAALVGYQSCGFAFVGTTGLAAPTDSTLVGPNRFALEVDATMVLNTGESRRIEEVVTAKRRDGSWRVHDIVVDGLSAEDLIPGPFDDRAKQLRLVITRLCLGPDRMEITGELVNEGEVPVTLGALAMLLEDGTPVAPLSVSVLPTGSLRPGDRAPLRLAFSGPQVLAARWIEVMAEDPLATSRDGANEPVRHEFILSFPPLFAGA